MIPAITTSLNFTNYAGLRLDALVVIFQTYFQSVSVYPLHRMPGESGPEGTLKYPCFMIDMPTTSAKKDRMGHAGAKYDRRFHFKIYWYGEGGNRQSLAQLQRGYAEALIKLFSDNALEDGTPRFKNNDPLWWNCEWDGDLRLSGSVNSLNNKDSFMRAIAGTLCVYSSIIQ